MRLVIVGGWGETPDWRDLAHRGREDLELSKFGREMKPAGPGT